MTEGLLHKTYTTKAKIPLFVHKSIVGIQKIHTVFLSDFFCFDDFRTGSVMAE